MGLFRQVTLRCLETFFLKSLLLLPFLHMGITVVYMKQMSDRVITTRYGKVRGMIVEFPNRHLRPVEAYLGLRYGDGGGMRFMPPRNPTEQWSETRVMMDHPAVCPQPTKNVPEHRKYLYEGRMAHLRNISSFLNSQKEDCLTLNLYVPVQAWNDTTPMAVMLFVHGDSYEVGTGNAYDGSVLSSFGDVIVVTLNYRLGVLGFLSTGDESAMGNYALLDVIQALIWLRENIASFSGDPGRVTVFGHGTGAVLVNLLMLTPFVKEERGDMFQRVILQSGSALSTWALSYDPKWCTENLAISVNCSRYNSNTKALINCLRQRGFSELVDSAPDAPKYFSCFAPSKDSYSVLPMDVKKLLKDPKSEFTSIPVMFGITKNEAYAYLKPEDIKKGISNSRKSEIIRTYIMNVFRYHRQKIFEILDHHYTDWTGTSDLFSNRDNTLELLSDGQFVAPLFEMANYHAGVADTYMYSFAYSKQSETYSDDIQAIHGDELPFVFGSPLVNGSSPFPPCYTDAEKMLSEGVMTYWTNFAKSGNPNEPRNQTSVHGDQVTNRFIDFTWPKYDKEKQEYLHIGRRPFVRHHYRSQKLALWLELIPKIDRDDGSSNRSSHLLLDAHNSSSFDDYHRLIPNFDTIFPSPPPIPPLCPTSISKLNDRSWTTPGYYSHVTDEELQRNKSGDSNKPPQGFHQSSERNGLSPEAGDGITVQPAESSLQGKSPAGVPLSIVVAIGGSLLLINVIIFAGLCYQRERIKKLRLINKPISATELDFDHTRFRRVESNQSSPCPTNDDGVGHECLSLMSATSSHQHPSPMKPTHQGNTHVHNPSPQISVHSRRGHSQPRVTPPLDSATCNYSALPTNVTSPIHRTHVGVSKVGVPISPGIVQVPAGFIREAAIDVDGTSSDGGVRGIGSGGVSTFTSGLPGGRFVHTGVGISGASNTTTHPMNSANAAAGPVTTASGGAVPGAAVASGAVARSQSNEDPVYKTINKSGQNNAVTIV